jgi:hypothetical protein
MDDATVQAMQGIADASARSVEQSGSSSTASLRSEYRRLRDEAALLNQRFGWASDEEFASMFPSPTQQGEIDALTVQVWGSDTIEPGSVEERLLSHLSAWASAVALAGRERASYDDVRSSDAGDE